MDAVGTPSSVLVVGGTSDIGLAVVERLGTGARLRVVLAARPSPRRDAAVQRLTAAGHQATVVDFDAEDTASHATTVEQAFAGGDLDVGRGRRRAARRPGAGVAGPGRGRAAAAGERDAAVSTGVLVAERLRRQGHGTVVALSSVAAERARRSNFVYGAGKAAMDAFYTACARRCGPTGSASSSCGGLRPLPDDRGAAAVPLSTTPEGGRRAASPRGWSSSAGGSVPSALGRSWRWSLRCRAGVRRMPSEGQVETASTSAHPHKRAERQQRRVPSTAVSAPRPRTASTTTA
jgi:decaprenylphospho-beta-D-erythro-pentofuranosid-2-ulose 2-reductase